MYLPNDILSVVIGQDRFVDASSRRQAVSASDVRNPLFARLYAGVCSRLMERELAEHRREMLSGLSGRVVEVGAGNGMNFRQYPATVEEVVAIEPEPYLRSAALRAAQDAAVEVTVLDGVAEALALEDGSFDAGVACLVLCTVPDPAGALAELRRVLSPGAELRFMEHVRSDRPLKATVQEVVDRSGVWPRLVGGCHCARDTVASVEVAGYRIERIRDFDLGPSWVVTNPYVIGVARAPGLDAAQGGR